MNWLYGIAKSLGVVDHFLLGAVKFYFVKLPR
jgi:hypothetical protein